MQLPFGAQPGEAWGRSIPPKQGEQPASLQPFWGWVLSLQVPSPQGLAEREEQSTRVEPPKPPVPPEEPPEPPPAEAPPPPEPPPPVRVMPPEPPEEEEVEPEAPPEAESPGQATAAFR